MEDRSLQNRGKPAKPRPSEKKILDAKPELDAQTLVVITCLRHLESERPRTWRAIPVKSSTFYGWHVGRIPWRAIAEWGRGQGLARDGIDLLVEVIRIHDDEREEQQASDLAAKTGA